MPLLKAPNRLREYYCFLRDTDTYLHRQALQAITQDLACNEKTFTKKIVAPNSFSNAEKRAIAQVYKQPVHFLFPEMELPQTA